MLYDDWQGVPRGRTSNTKMQKRAAGEVAEQARALQSFQDTLWGSVQLVTFFLCTYQALDLGESS